MGSYACAGHLLKVGETMLHIMRVTAEGVVQGPREERRHKRRL